MRQSTNVLIDDIDGQYSQLKYDSEGQAKIVRQIKESEMEAWIISHYEKDDDFDEDQLKNSHQGFITNKGESLFVWTRKCKSTEAYQVSKLKNGMKVVVLNVEEHRQSKYQLVNNYLVRKEEDADHFEVYKLSFKKGKLEVGLPVGQFNKMKKVSIKDFPQEVEKFHAVSRHS